MRKKLTVAIATLTAAIFAAFTSTFSWFAAKNTVTFPSSFGSAQAAYFAGGDGSKENPYLISSPVHLYNLAWLQYLGYFNLNADFNNGRAQNFFALARSIDCNLSIPPIGTEQYPFIGNFDGNGYVISNVTVSNYSADLTRRPANAQFTADVLSMPLNGGYVSDVSIVGLFGVTGDYDKFVENHYKKTDVGVTTYGELTAPGDLPSTVDVNEFYYSAMTVKNFYINSLHVKSHSKETLAGLVAGYVCSNVQNTGTYACDVSLSGTKSGKSDAKNASGEAHNYEKTVSKYSIVGDYDETIVGWVEKPTETTGGGEQGDGAAWGGSIDMRTLNRRLSNMIAKIGPGNNTVNDTGFHLNVTHNKNFFWNGQGTTAAIAYLNDGTVLPISVDLETMGLKELTGDDTAGNKYSYNSYYKDNTAESVAKNNTGYIVSAGEGNNSQQGGSYIRSRIQPLASGSYKGIYKSLGYSTTQTGGVEYNASNFEMLTIDIEGDTYRIKDKINEDTTINDRALKYTQKSYTELGFSNSGKNYDAVRTNFDNTMKGSKMVHGFHFMNFFSVDDYEVDSTTIKNISLIKGGLNFTVQSDGVIKTILGAFYSTSNKQTLFDLYKVNRNDDGTIASVTRIKDIYKDAAGKIVYDPETTEGYTKIFSFENLTKTDAQNTDGKILINGAAYYFEIPVTKGDYFISSDKTSSSNNAYLMYLDIGANGDGDDSTETPGTEKMPYDITRVDFVSQYTGSSDFSVPRTSEGATYFPNYKDVTFLLALLGTDGSKATVAYKRDDYDTDPLTADELNQIATLVKYYAANVTLTATPSANLSAPDESLKEE